MTNSTDLNLWFGVREACLSGDPAWPSTEQGGNLIVSKEGWRQMHGKSLRQGNGWLYHASLFPPSTVVRMLLKRTSDKTERQHQAISSDLWAHFETLSESHKAQCKNRLEAVQYAHRLMSVGMTLVAAVALAASEAKVSSSTLRNWLTAVRGHNRADWLAALAPHYKATAQFAECHPDAWQALKSDYLRPGEPKFSACYRRMTAAAARLGWSPIPSEMALRRRLQAEVPAAVITLTRKGEDKAKAIYPAQRRTRRKLKAMTLVNIDGHRFDVFVRKGDGAPFRPTLVAIQDIYSGKFVGWRLDETESRVSVRLAIGDMVERFGIPEEMILDNGRGFASKWITGGVANRFRFKVKDDEPDGLLTNLGVKIHWATPYHGQAKPIERAFRDFCEDIAKHPFCDGAYTGNNPLAKPENYGKRAIEWEAFRAFVDGMIAEHNARTGRNTETAKGSSFDAVFTASLAENDTIVRWPTAEQRDLWLLMAEEITAQRGTGVIHLMGNRYWSPAMTEFAGRKVHVRFDPDDLTRDIKIYDRKGRMLAKAELLGDADFLDAEAAQRQGRMRAEFQKTNRKLRDLHVTLQPAELGQLYAPQAKPETAPQRPAVTRLATRGNAALKAEREEAWNQEHEDGFGTVVGMISQKLAKRGG
jgi:putative transposase